jgi:hypothetical protein
MECRKTRTNIFWRIPKRKFTKKRGCLSQASSKQRFQGILPAILASRGFAISSAVCDLKQMLGIPNSKNQLYI